MANTANAVAVPVRERGILMSGPMVRACLRAVDPKTKTRRVMKPQPDGEPRSREEWASGLAGAANYGRTIMMHEINQKALQLTGKVFPFRRPGSTSLYSPTCPYGQPGDRLWVREAFFDHGPFPGDQPTPLDARIEYREDEWDRAGGDAGGGWKPSIHMPRWASRLTLEITEVRVERVQEISEDDCWAEGIERSPESPTQASTVYSDYAHPRRAYCLLWDSLNAKRGFGWEVNPWVWVLTFVRLESAGACTGPVER